MPRSVYVLVLLVASHGFLHAQPAGNLELELPRSSDPPSFAPDRLSKLEIDGKDFTLPRETRRVVSVEPKMGDSVKVVYTFWPNTYTKFVRTKVVKLDKGKVAKASLLEPNPDVPDQIYVIYFPTPPAVVRKMCELAKITKDDVVCDIGCGDGRMVITAVKEFGAKKGIGVDIGADRIKESESNAKKAGVADRIEFKLEDALQRTDWSHVDVVLIYLSDPLNEALRPALQKTLKPGARIVSHRFLMGDWKPDQSINIRATNNYGEDEAYVLHVWTIKGEPKR
jgi:predicted O-methyltransferase YrrM